MLGLGLKHKYPVKLAKQVTAFKDRVETDSGIFLHRFGVRDPLKFSDDASLVITPNAIKAGKLYSVIPSDGTGDGTVSRGTKGTYVDKDGLIKEAAIDEPRITWEDGEPAILMEPERENLVPDNDDLKAASWINVDMWVTGGFKDVFGGFKAFSLVHLVESGSTRLRSSQNLNDNSTYVASVFVKDNGQDFAHFVYFQNNGISGGNEYYNLRYKFSTESLEYSGFQNDDGYISSGYKKYKNGYVRLWVVFNSGVSSTGRLQLNRNIVFGNSPGLLNAIFCYPQVEKGEYPRSIIPTSGSTVTRNKELFDQFGNSSLFNSNEFTFFVDFKALANSNNTHRITLSDGSDDNRIIVGYRGLDNAIYIFLSNNSTGDVVAKVIHETIIVYNKIAVRIKDDDINIYMNGSPKGSSNDFTVWNPGTINELRFANTAGSIFNYEGKIKSLAVYNRGLTDQELEILTS